MTHLLKAPLNRSKECARFANFLGVLFYDLETFLRTASHTKGRASSHSEDPVGSLHDEVLPMQQDLNSQKPQ
jgi:hypothetical protein